MEPVSEVKKGIVKCLHDEDHNKENGDTKDVLRSKKQGKLEPWTWLRLESWNLIIDIGNKIKEDANGKLTV